MKWREKLSERSSFFLPNQFGVGRRCRAAVIGGGVDETHQTEFLPTKARAKKSPSQKYSNPLILLHFHILNRILIKASSSIYKQQQNITMKLITAISSIAALAVRCNADDTSNIIGGSEVWYDISCGS
jgi:hypothetical protein